MPAQFKQVISSLLTWSAYKKLAMSAAWNSFPGIWVLILSPALDCLSCQTSATVYWSLFYLFDSTLVILLTTQSSPKILHFFVCFIFLVHFTLKSVMVLRFLSTYNITTRHLTVRKTDNHLKKGLQKLRLCIVEKKETVPPLRRTSDTCYVGRY